MDDMETCSWCTTEVPDESLRECDDGARICPGCYRSLTVTVADGRVGFHWRNVTVATCDRVGCIFRSGLTECLCDHWHDCVTGPYEPECNEED